MKKGVVAVMAMAAFILAAGQTGAAGMPNEITFTTGGGLATSVYAASSALAPVMERKMGIKVRVTPFEVVRDRYTALRDGKAHVNLAAMMNATFASEGYGPSFADAGFGPQPFRHVWFFYSQQWGYMVRGDSDIQSIYDIKGRRVGLGRHSQGCINAFEALLAYVNLKESDVKMVPVGSWAALQRVISEGRADVTFTAAESGVVYEVEANPKGIRFLEMPHKDKEAWKRFLAVNISAFPVTINKGVKSARGVESFASAYSWVVYKDSSEEFVYQMTKFAAENWNEFRELHNVFKDDEGTLENQKKYLKSLGIPVHPGAIRYLKEVGCWTAETETINNKNLDLEKRYEAAWQAALAEAAAKKINISPKNQEWMDLWDSHRSNLPRKGTRID